MRSDLSYSINPYGEHLLVKFSYSFPDLGLLPVMLKEFGISSRVGVDSLLIENRYIADSSELSSLLNILLDSFGSDQKIYTEKESSSNSSERREIIISVDYSLGLDLETLAEALNFSSQELVSLHAGTIWRVALLGFAPGFPYLAPLSNQDVWGLASRLKTPRTSVPKGSVAVAAGMSCIYPQQMPGGWNVIGVAEVELFNPNSDSPSLLSAGDTVKFEVKNA